MSTTEVIPALLISGPQEVTAGSKVRGRTSIGFGGFGPLGKKYQISQWSQECPHLSESASLWGLSLSSEI